MKRFSVIMAGGGGTRFWPLSRQDMPKQLLNLSGSDAMINETIRRGEKVIPTECTYIVTNERQATIMKDILVDSLPRQNILVEPVGRNTAPCILYACMHIYETQGDGIVTVLPSDHYVTNEDEYQNVLNHAIAVAEETEDIVTIGIQPTFASTGYGYIKIQKESSLQNNILIDRFEEKPSLEKAKEYVRTGDYYWNSGIFVCKISVMLAIFERFLPRIYCQMKKLGSSFGTEEEIKKLKEIYPTLDSISMDYGIMERVSKAYVVPGDFGWNDVGSWDALGAVFESDDNGNIVKSEHIGIETKKCIIYGNKKLITTVGIENTIIVDTEDAILICDKEKAQNVKDIVDLLKAQGKLHLL